MSSLYRTLRTDCRGLVSYPRGNTVCLGAISCFLFVRPPPLPRPASNPEGGIGSRHPLDLEVLRPALLFFPSILLFAHMDAGKPYQPTDFLAVFIFIVPFFLIPGFLLIDIPGFSSIRESNASVQASPSLSYRSSPLSRLTRVSHTSSKDKTTSLTGTPLSARGITYLLVEIDPPRPLFGICQPVWARGPTAPSSTQDYEAQHVLVVHSR